MVATEDPSDLTAQAEHLLTNGAYTEASKLSQKILHTVTSLRKQQKDKQQQNDGNSPPAHRRSSSLQEEPVDLNAALASRAAAVLLQSLFETDKFSSAAPSMISAFGSFDDAPPTVVLLWVSLALDEPDCRSSAHDAVLRLLRTKAPRNSGWTRRHYLTLLALYVMECVLPAVGDVSQVRLWLQRQNYLALDPRELAYLDGELEAAEATNEAARTGAGTAGIGIGIGGSTGTSRPPMEDNTTITKNNSSISGASAFANTASTTARIPNNANTNGTKTTTTAAATATAAQPPQGRHRSTACLAALDAAAQGDLRSILAETSAHRRSKSIPGLGGGNNNNSSSSGEGDGDTLTEERREDEDVLSTRDTLAPIADPGNFALSPRDQYDYDASTMRRRRSLQSPPLSPLPTYTSEMSIAAGGSGFGFDRTRSGAMGGNTINGNGGSNGNNNYNDYTAGSRSSSRRISEPGDKQAGSTWGIFGRGGGGGISVVDEVDELDWLGKGQHVAFAAADGAYRGASKLFRSVVGGGGGGGENKHKPHRQQQEQQQQKDDRNTTEISLGRRRYDSSSNSSSGGVAEASASASANNSTIGATLAVSATAAVAAAVVVAAWSERAWLKREISRFGFGIVRGLSELGSMALTVNPNPRSQLNY